MRGGGKGNKVEKEATSSKLWGKLYMADKVY